MQPMDSTPEFTTGAAWMDSLHRGVARSLRRTCEARDHELCAAYGALVACLERAFSAEEDRMEETDPAATRSHREQHARVLQGLHCVHAQLLGGDVQLGRKIAADLLPRWLTYHIAAMDVPLAKATENGDYAVSRSGYA